MSDQPAYTARQWVTVHRVLHCLLDHHRYLHPWDEYEEVRDRVIHLAIEEALAADPELDQEQVCQRLHRKEETLTLQHVGWVDPPTDWPLMAGSERLQWLLDVCGDRRAPAPWLSQVADRQRLALPVPPGGRRLVSRENPDPSCVLCDGNPDHCPIIADGDEWGWGWRLCPHAF